MDYDFAEFLRGAEESCKTKDDFLKRISNEIELVEKTPSDPPSNLDRQAYLKRIEGAEFAAKTDQFKEPDKFNDELRNLLEGL